MIMEERSTQVSSLNNWVDGGGPRRTLGCGQFHFGQLKFEVAAQKNPCEG